MATFDRLFPKDFGMLKNLMIGLLSLFTLTLSAQVFNPVKWTYDKEQISDDTYDLLFKATMEPHWHIYSTTLSPDEGPIPTSFDFMELNGCELVDGIKEPKPIKEYDKNFAMDLLFFSDKATFKQRVKLTGEKASVKGELTYMVCDDSKCLPPEYLDFSFDLEKNVKVSAPKDQSTESTVEENSSLNSDPLSGGMSGSQPEIFNPVSWKYDQKTLDNGEIQLRITATIDEGWHLYSQTLPSDDGPIATEFRYFTDKGQFETVGNTEEMGELHKEFDPNFNMELSYYEGTVTFVQKIKATSEEATIVPGDIYYMVCDAEKCLPPETVEFEFNIGGSDQASISETRDIESGPSPSRSLIGIFIAGFLGGLLALLTPCVFPMIPLTVSFFTKQSKTRAQGISNAILYGVSIIAIYTILGYLVTAIFGADALNALSTNVWFNLAFFVLLTVFAISFFGAFEITLPSSWVNKVDQQSYKGGLLGIFFMAFTLSLVSFSCTGPIIGTLLVEAAVNGGVAGPLIGMGGFSLALALPFGLFAAFPGWMNSLPSSGGWLNSVKVVLGFLELGLALKFLSNADLVVQAGILTRELFIALWIAIAAGLTLYLFGAIRLPHDSKMEKMSVGRMLFGIVTLTFTLYLIPGLWGAPLKLISGFPPPMFYSESPQGVGKGGTMIAAAGVTGGTHSPSGNHATCPHNLNCFHDYEEGLAYAKEVGKPVMLDFTGWACVNCRKMEEQVWAENPVLSRMRDNVVLISLYVDEKTELPEGEQYTSPTTGKKIKTIGNKWSDLQIKRYQSNSQPYYVILDHEENQLIESASYDPDVDKFVDWLDRGVAKFNDGKAS